MKSIISKTLTLVAIAATLLSFSANFGGEGFQISVNGKIMLQQFGKDMDAVKILRLDQNSPNDKITIRYYHCGKAGKNRTVTIKDESDKLVKVWHFKDTDSVTGDMSCSAGDIMNLTRAGNKAFKIYYASSELPAGRMLTKLIFGNNSTAARK